MILNRCTASSKLPEIRPIYKPCLKDGWPGFDEMKIFGQSSAECTSTRFRHSNEIILHQPLYPFDLVFFTCCCIWLSLRYVRGRPGSNVEWNERSKQSFARLLHWDLITDISTWRSAHSDFEIFHPSSNIQRHLAVCSHCQQPDGKACRHLGSTSSWLSDT